MKISSNKQTNFLRLDLAMRDCMRIAWTASACFGLLMYGFGFAWLHLTIFPNCIVRHVHG